MTWWAFVRSREAGRRDDGVARLRNFLINHKIEPDFTRMFREDILEYLEGEREQCAVSVEKSKNPSAISLLYSLADLRNDFDRSWTEWRLTLQEQGK